MSAHDSGFAAARIWWALRELANRWPVKASGRALAICPPVGGMIAALSDLPDADPGSNDRLIDLGIAGVAAGILVLLLRRFGQGRGIVFGLKLTTVSYLFWQSLVMTAFTAWTASGMDGSLETDWGFVAFSAVLSAALFIPTAIMLRRLDPDF
jgi:hypothetical protein